VQAAIQGGADWLDTAYAVQDFGGSSGVAGMVYVRDLVGLAAGQVLNGNLAVLQVRDAAGVLVYELYLAPDRSLRLWSPAGGLGAAALNLSTGSVVPNDGSSSIRVEVAALASGSLTVRVDGVDKVSVGALSGATSGNQRFLQVGIDHYDTSSTNEPVAIVHASPAAGQSGWLGPPPPPTNTALPAITGSAAQDQVLTAGRGSWTSRPTGYAYQWQRCDGSGASCAAVAGATGTSYTVVAADVGSTLRVQVTASNSGGSTTASSAATAVVAPPLPANTTLPAITGSAVQGQVLSASQGSWTGSPTGYGYQWQRCDGSGAGCSAIAGATGTSYTVVAADVGSTLRVQVTASNAGGSTSASSAATAGVIGIVTDPGCGGCSVLVGSDGTVQAAIQGGADWLDTAYAVQDFGGSSGVAGMVYVRDLVGLAAGQVLNGNLAVLQVRDAAGVLVYELYLAPDRSLRLWSPAGGLGAAALNLSTGSVVPNDGSSSIRVEVAALASGSLTVRVDGVDKVSVGALSGATSGNQRFLQVGIDHYDTSSTNEPVAIVHASPAAGQSGWLGPPPPPASKPRASARAVAAVPARRRAEA
jgi:hypothetical protein